MAPVGLEPEVHYLPLAVSIGHLTGVSYLIWAVVQSLYKSAGQLTPSQDTRMRLTRRLSLAPLFALLAAVSLFVATRASFAYAKLSYRVWASERGFDVPDRFYGNRGVLPSNENATAIYVARWLSDTPVYMDAFEIVAEKARRFWWGQQIDLATMSWSLLLSIEGRRRNIPLLWAYLALSHMVNLSFAQNLFYLALIFTPSPVPSESDDATAPSRYTRIRDAVFPPKPLNWCPHPGLLLGSYVLNFAALLMVPVKAGTASFPTMMVLTRAFTLMPLAIPAMSPVSWGTVHPHPHRAYGAFSDMFRLISAFGFVLHGKATVLGLVANAPDAHHHRHSLLLPFDTERLGAWERTTTAFGRVLAATADHPVVAAVGWDVLLSGVGLGLWAAVRAVSVDDILACSVPLYAAKKKKDHYYPLTAPTPDLDVGRFLPETMTTTAVKTEDASGSESTTATTATRRRGRPRKTHRPALQMPEDDAAAAASPRKRGRPKKGADGDDSGTYRPESDIGASVVEGDVVLPDGELDWESTALTWGLTVLGGLGCGSAGVFGGECISR